MFPLSDTVPARIFPIWTILIILANVYIFYLELTSANFEAFVFQYALIPARVDFTQPLTLIPFITSQFLHAGFLHIISNMWFLWVFGDNVEGKFRFSFLIFYLLGGVAGGLLQYMLTPDSALPMLGASGAVAGVLGAYFALFPGHRIRTLVFIFLFFTVVEIPASIMLFYWFFTQVFSVVAIATTGLIQLGGVAWFAHIGGFITGWVIAKTR